MKKRITMLVAGMLMLSGTSMAQDYYHGGGGAVNYAIYSLSYSSPTENYSGTSGAAVPGIFYKATLGLTDNFAISAYPFIGFAGSANSRTGGSGSFGVELPINAELWLGSMDDGAFFLGGGFNMAFMATSGYGGGSIVGPQFALGGQFTIQDRLVGIRVGYTHGINSTKIDDSTITISKDKKFMLGFGAYYQFGY